MHQQAIDLRTYVELRVELEVEARIDAGTYVVTTARHPELGNVVLIQDSQPGLFLLSERPLDASLN